MFYNRFWFDHDRYGLTLGGGKINKPGTLPRAAAPINGATAASAHRTLRRIQGTNSKHGTLPEHLTGCRANTLLFAGSSITVRRMCRTSRDLGELHRRVPLPPIVENICGSLGHLCRALGARGHHGMILTTR